MKLKIRRLSLASLMLGMMIFGCSQDNEQFDVLTAENSQLSISYEQQLVETRSAVERADSLQTVVHDLAQEVHELKGEAPVYHASKADEEAIEALVQNLHHGWASMFKTNDTNDLLKFFLPKYTTSAIRINTENIPSVRRKNNSSFEEFLNQLIAANNISLSFGETRFLYTEVKGDVFVTTYRTRFRVYENNKQRHTSSLITQLSGERDGEWKVGDYHWVTFNY
ncbi:MAG: hypothetical protein E2O88_05560 [Bacteroidetes bacterium]|nr:MAG: hypothetical protein E2O88_05560 [Bacteroidota bacterium]